MTGSPRIRLTAPAGASPEVRRWLRECERILSERMIKNASALAAARALYLTTGTVMLHVNRAGRITVLSAKDIGHES